MKGAMKHHNWHYAVWALRQLDRPGVCEPSSDGATWGSKAWIRLGTADAVGKYAGWFTKVSIMGSSASDLFSCPYSAKRYS